MHFVVAIGFVRVSSSVSWLVPLGSLLLPRITIGYHRLWSHRSFTARRPLRLVLAVMGALGFQGSIKVCRSLLWRHVYLTTRVLIHYASGGACDIDFIIDLQTIRLMTHTPQREDYCTPMLGGYSANLNMKGCHGSKKTIWREILVRQRALPSVEYLMRPISLVVRLQHRYYIPIALFFGLISPALIARMWGDSIGGFVYGGILARILSTRAMAWHSISFGLTSRLTVWHCTFMINSLAHWEGLQPYTNEVTARGNLVSATSTS